MRTHPDFHDALMVNLTEIHTEPCGPISKENGFTITEDEEGVYSVDGECWTFYIIRRDGQWQSMGWREKMGIPEVD